MKWVLLNRTHVNTNNIDCFRWEDGKLALWFIGDQEPAQYIDPDRELYRKLCSALGVQPYEEESHGQE